MKKVHGFSRFELMVVAILLGIVSTMLLNRLRFYQEAAEKAQMEYTVSTLKSALRLRKAALLVEGRAYAFGSLALENPMDWLETKPANYSPQIDAMTADSSLAGTWYFDRADRTLIYVVDHGDHFKLDSTGKKRVRLHMVRVPTVSDDALLKSGRAASESVALELVEPFSWL
jgi:type II secretory pathway pseudopilin PulG